MTILVTGGAGFIGANFVLDRLQAGTEPIVTLDALTYAGNRANLAAVEGDQRHLFVHGSIDDEALVGRLLREHDIRAVVHFAAESHVDRSIASPRAFFDTNVLGTLALLQAAREYVGKSPELAERFRFLHVSTDEVYGALTRDEPPFTEANPYRPNSPYAASKAASDHVVRSYHQTYGLKTLITHCSNNYGPFQFPEKLIPLVIRNALTGEPLPIYGDGQQVRDWLYVGDHCTAIARVLEAGVPGQVYDIGGDNEVTNIDIVQQLCALLDRKRPRAGGGSYAEQITYVTDRPGHDRRYAIDFSKLNRELGWRPSVDLATGLERTVDWYLDNQQWVEGVTSGSYRDWIARQYG